jgi:hypothetical protein
MERLELLEMASKFVDENIVKVPTNTRGYVADGWKPPTAWDRWQLIESVADYLSKTPSKIEINSEYGKVKEIDAVSAYPEELDDDN